MKRWIGFTVLMFALCISAFGQGGQGLSQAFTETITLAPPAINNALTSSNSTGTGIAMLPTGGTIASGTYRVSVTLNTLTGTESPQSADTTAASTVTCSTGTCTLVIQPPVANGTGANVVGWRMGVSANGGATATETLQTITNLVCSLSPSSTTSCSLASPATFTASTNFSAGSGIGPATPGTAIFPALNQAANIALFENSGQTYRSLNWIVSGTAPSACTIQIQTGATIAALANVGQSITCTSTGGYAFPSTATAVYSSVQLSAYTAGDTTTKVTFYYNTLPFNLSGNYYFGNAVPTGSCPTGGVYDNTAGGVSTTIYTCNAGTWTAVTVP